MLQITGIVESGMGKARLFLSLPHYSDFFTQLLGQKTFAGTLNVRIEEKICLQMKEKAAKSFRLEEKTFGEKKLGGVSCLKASVCKAGAREKLTCLLIFPDKSTHEKNIVEIVAAQNLRQKLSLRNGEKVEIRVE